jgi:glucosamine 6-phosphate synthetase-like amidotransferase/phosphosugar isomerase protein
MSFNIEIDTENVVHLQMEYYRDNKNNDFMKFLGK